VKPPKLSPTAAKSLRGAVDDAATKNEIRTAKTAVRSEHPDWSDADVELAALVKIANRDGIDW
jgi:hypothetical protein